MVTKRSLRDTAERKMAAGVRAFNKRRSLDGTDGQVIAKNLKTGEIQTLSFKRRELPWEEYRLLYRDARNYLLSQGYEKRAPNLDAQILFAEMIPDSAELKQERRTTLKQLRSRDENKRFLAAKHLDKLARHRHQDEFVVRHPDIVRALIDALKTETRRKTPSLRLQEMLIAGLGAVHERHLEDYRIFDELLAHLNSPEKTLRIRALRSTSRFRDSAKWPHVLAALSDPSSTMPVLSASLEHVEDRIPLSVKRKLQPILVDLLGRRLGANVQGQLTWAICCTVEERTVDAMVELLKKSRGARKLLAKEVQMSSCGDRQEFLQSQLISRLS